VLSEIKKLAVENEELKNKVNEKKRTQIAQLAVKMYSFRLETLKIIAEVEQLNMRAYISSKTCSK
jgi:hypothetical protein